MKSNASVRQNEQLLKNCERVVMKKKIPRKMKNCRIDYCHLMKFFAQDILDVILFAASMMDYWNIFWKKVFLEGYVGVLFW